MVSWLPATIVGSLPQNSKHGSHTQVAGAFVKEAVALVSRIMGSCLQGWIWSLLIMRRASEERGVLRLAACIWRRGPRGPGKTQKTERLQTENGAPIHARPSGEGSVHPLCFYCFPVSFPKCNFPFSILTRHISIHSSVPAQRQALGKPFLTFLWHALLHSLCSQTA